MSSTSAATPDGVAPPPSAPGSTPPPESPDGAAGPGAEGGGRPGGPGGVTRVATFALVVAVMALVSAWTGWGGMLLGVVAVVAALVAVTRARSGRGPRSWRPVGALGVGLVAVTIGTAVEWPTLQSAVTYMHVSQVRTLDECMRLAVNEKEQRVCKSQHLDEWNLRNPGDTDP